MKKYLVILVLFIQVFTTYGQTDLENAQLLTTSKINNFVYTYSGAVISGKTMDVNSSDKTPYISMDSLKVNLSDIQFLKYGENYWANTIKLNNRNSFALRNYKGKLNIYTKIVSRDETQYLTIFNSGNRIRTAQNDITIEQNYDYYNKGFGNLKPVKYEYLINDIGDNKKSFAFLKKSNRFKKLKVGSFIAGVVSIAVGIVVKTDNKVIKSVPFLLGAGFVWGGVQMRDKQEDYLIEAVKSY